MKCVGRRSRRPTFTRLSYLSHLSLPSVPAPVTSLVLPAAASSTSPSSFSFGELPRRRTDEGRPSASASVAAPASPPPPLAERVTEVATVEQTHWPDRDRSTDRPTDRT